MLHAFLRTRHCTPYLLTPLLTVYTLPQRDGGPELLTEKHRKRTVQQRVRETESHQSETESERKDANERGDLTHL